MNTMSKYLCSCATYAFMNNDWYLHTSCGMLELKPHHILCNQHLCTHANIIIHPYSHPSQIFQCYVHDKNCGGANQASNPWTVLFSSHQQGVHLTRLAHHLAHQRDTASELMRFIHHFITNTMGNNRC